MGCILRAKINFLNYLESIMADTYDGQKIYKPWVLRVYDIFVLFLSNRYIWKCHSKYQLKQYEKYTSNNHLDIGVGSGYYLSKHYAERPKENVSITLADLNQNSLHFAENRIKKHNPALLQLDIMQPLSPEIKSQKYDSIGINYLLHCLPGEMKNKDIVFKNIADILNPSGVCFGATLVNDYKNKVAIKLAGIYNKKGVFSNQKDTKESLEENLKKYFSSFETQQIGSVVLFKAEL